MIMNCISQRSPLLDGAFGRTKPREEHHAAVRICKWDLNDPVWYLLPGCGWLPAAAALGACIAHGWSEFVQLRQVSGIETKSPAPEVVHSY